MPVWGSHPSGKIQGDEKEQQAQQSLAGEDILKTIGCFPDQAAAPRFPFLRADRLGNMDQEQGQDGNDKGRHINKEDAGQA